ncbi:MFS transporter [Aspergillus egyptiacus]|nr:MFS transporter [Aspergillus egyptiacus]
MGRPPPWIRRLGLDSRTLLMMLKGGLPPTIVIAISQSDAIADITGTVGYLSALISFMKIMLFDLLATCVSASLCCLAVFCAVQAREHHAPSADGYSSDACAVAAVWLVVMIWLANALRAWRPAELQDPMVAFSVFCCLTLTRAGTFGSVSAGLQFITTLLKGFMLGFSIATGVSLLIYPMTSRGSVFRDIQGYVTQIEAVLQRQLQFVRSSGDPGSGARGLLSRNRTARSTRNTVDGPESEIESAANALQAAMANLDALHGKLQSDLFYSGDEMAWGKLGPNDLDHIAGLLQNVFLPLSGMAMLPHILGILVNRETPDPCEEDPSRDAEEASEKQVVVGQVMEMLQQRLTVCADLVNAGLRYALTRLEVIQCSHNGTKDEETGKDIVDPAQPNFADHFEQGMRAYHSEAMGLHHRLARLEGFVATTNDGDLRLGMFLLLYMSQLQDKLLTTVLDVIKFADGKIADGTMARGRLICPLGRSIQTWCSIPSNASDPGRRPSSPVTSSALNQEIQPTRHPDPEHLPPANGWERASAKLRLDLVRSDQSVFGFRVAAASICVGILAYLHQTQEFFLRQRGMWVMIVIVIGMSPTSGQTLLGFVTRIAATAVSLALSLMVWYIPDQQTAGVIVFLYLANVFEYYFYITKPQLFGPSVIAIVTLNVIVGYELQIRKLGREVGTSNGQEYYPIYLFGPIKLLAVVIGCAISFFWVIFPYPVTSRSALRRRLGRGLILLANFYSCTHSTIELWLRGELGDVQDPRSSSFSLQQSRHALFNKETMVLSSLRLLRYFSLFEPSIGGKFPTATYDQIISEIQRMLISLALMAQITQSLGAVTGENPARTAEDKWASRLASIALQSEGFKSHAVTSLLCHLGSSITNAQPLPPYLSAGTFFPLARQLQQIDEEMLSLRHVEDPAFPAFLSLEVLRSVVSSSLSELLRNTKALVGELSFESHIQSPAESERRGLLSEQE